MRTRSATASFMATALAVVAGGRGPAQDVKPQAVLRYDGVIRGLAFSLDGKALAASDDFGTLTAFALPGGVNPVALRAGNIKGPIAGLWSLAYAPDGKTLAGSDIEGGLEVWDVGQKKQLFVLPADAAKKSPGMAVAFSPDGKLVAVGRLDATVRVWNVAARKEVASFTGCVKTVTDVAFSPDGKALAVAGGERVETGAVKVWDTATWKETRTLGGMCGQATAVAFSPDGTLIAAGAELFAVDGKANLRVWDARTGAEKATPKGHFGLVSTLAFDPDGKTLVSVSSPAMFGDLALRKWDVATGKQTDARTGFMFGRAALSPDCKTLATAGPFAVQLWDVGKLEKAGR